MPERTIDVTRLFAIVTILFTFQQVYAQAFTRVTNAGEIVTRNASSWSSSWGDFNNDGFMDLHVISNPTSSLHLNNGNGTFTRITSGPVVNTNDFQNSAIWGDYDNDGFLDLYVSNLGPGTPIQPGQPLNPQDNFLYRNQGAPDFSFGRVRTNGVEIDSNMTWTSTFTDFDNDGDLDLFVPGDQGDRDIFFENDDSGNFTNRTDLPFLDPGEFSAGGSWIDFDNDGDEDLLVVNFMRRSNELYRNLLKDTGNLEFEKVTSGPIVQDFEDDLVPSFGDYDNDGDLDVFMAVWSNRNNTLYRNDGGLQFTKISQQPMVTDLGWTLGNSWIDYDNDGFLDLFVTDTRSSNRLYRNNGDGTFTKKFSGEIGALVTPAANASGCSVADYDNDGDQDIFIPVPGVNLLFRNDIGHLNNWLVATCIGVVSNKSGVGAKIRLKANINGQDMWQMRYIPGGPTGDRAQNSPRAHFGLGNAVLVDSLVVEWPSGMVDIFTSFLPNKFITITEGGSITNIEGQTNSQPARFALRQNYPNPFNPNTAIRYEIPDEGHVTLTIYNLAGKKIRILVNETQSTGEKSTVWNGIDSNGFSVAAGTYFYQLKVGDQAISRKMTLLK